MRFQNVRIAAFSHVLPPNVVSSEELEARLRPVYERFRVRPGRLELMSGIRERRFWDKGSRPSEVAAQAGHLALERSGVPRDRIGCLIHASVCRDFLEPAPATVVHHALDLPDRCSVFDLSNACLGVANGMVQIGHLIEAGAVEAGLVVAGEDGGPLVEETLRSLLEDEKLDKAGFKRAFASLTIGAGAAAVVLERAPEGETGRRLVGSATLSATEHSALCQGDRIDGGEGPLMSTDSEALLQAGNRLAMRTFEDFCSGLNWQRDDIDRIVTHQVGSAHRRLLFESLDLDLKRDYPTVQTLGNIGSVSLPLSFSMAEEAGFIHAGHRVAMLGIGSGLNCQMLGVEW